MALCRLHEVLMPAGEGGFGIEVEAETHRVTSVWPGGIAYHAGIMAGDIIMAVDEAAVTDVPWEAGVEAGTFRIGAPSAVIPVTEVMAPGAPEFNFKVLRPLEEAEGAPTAPAQDYETVESQPVYEDPVPSFQEPSPGEAGPSTARDPYAEARFHYPWATEIRTQDGDVKTKYNMVRGTVLQPLQTVTPSRETEQRKLAFAANGRMSGAVGRTHGASGLVHTVFGMNQ